LQGIVKHNKFGFGDYLAHPQTALGSRLVLRHADGSLFQKEIFEPLPDMKIGSAVCLLLHMDNLL
jgi:hypothetical protein